MTSMVYYFIFIHIIIVNTFDKKWTVKCKYCCYSQHQNGYFQTRNDRQILLESNDDLQ